MLNSSINRSQIVAIQRSIVSADSLASVVAEAYGLHGVRCQLIKSATLDIYQVSIAVRACGSTNKLCGGLSSF
jgi:hypothetical protein